MRRQSADFTPFSSQSWERRSYDASNIWAPVDSPWSISPRRHLHGDLFTGPEMLGRFGGQPGEPSYQFASGRVSNAQGSPLVPQAMNSNVTSPQGLFTPSFQDDVRHQMPSVPYSAPHAQTLGLASAPAPAPAQRPPVAATHLSHRTASVPHSSHDFPIQQPNPDAAKLQIVHDYFVADAHQRVQVTVDFLSQRFREEHQYLSDTHQLPRFPVDHNSRAQQLILVAFKAGRIDVFSLPAEPPHMHPQTSAFNVGDLVIVEADRGHDLGKIVRKNVSTDEARLLKLLQFQEQQSALSDHDLSSILIKNLHPHSPGHNQTPHTLHFPKPILGLAQQSETLQILTKKQDEEKACRLCVAKIANTTACHTTGFGNVNTLDLLQMSLVDAEYQFDRKKLIFYYSTSKRIDFRDLVRELFRIYKTRIWMCAVIGHPYAKADHKTLQQTSQKTGSVSAATALQTSRHKQRHHSWSHPALNASLNYTDIPHESAREYAPDIPEVSLTESYSPVSGLHSDVPRRFPRGNRTRPNAESFVLKSLVDSINF